MRNIKIITKQIERKESKCDFFSRNRTKLVYKIDRYVFFNYANNSFDPFNQNKELKYPPYTDIDNMITLRLLHNFYDFGDEGIGFQSFFMYNRDKWISKEDLYAFVFKDQTLQNPVFSAFKYFTMPLVTAKDYVEMNADKLIAKYFKDFSRTIEIKIDKNYKAKKESISRLFDNWILCNFLFTNKNDLIKTVKLIEHFYIEQIKNAKFCARLITQDLYNTSFNFSDNFIPFITRLMNHSYSDLIDETKNAIEQNERKNAIEIFNFLNLNPFSPLTHFVLRHQSRYFYQLIDNICEEKYNEYAKQIKAIKEAKKLMKLQQQQYEEGN